MGHPAIGGLIAGAGLHFFVPEARGSGIPQVKTAFHAVGLVGGLAAVAFNESLLRLRRWFRRSGVPACATPGLGGLMLGCIGLAALLFTQSSSIFGVGCGTLSMKLQGSLPLKVLIILGVCKLAGTVLSYSSGSAGGIFGPSPLYWWDARRSRESAVHKNDR